MKPKPVSPRATKVITALVIAMFIGFGLFVASAVNNPPGACSGDKPLRGCPWPTTTTEASK